MSRRPRPTRPTRQNPRAQAATMTIEVIERHQYTVPNDAVTADLRKALKSGDIERIAELVDFITDETTPESCVLDVNEVR